MTSPSQPIPGTGPGSAFAAEFELQGTLGRGGQATVFRALQHRLERVVAVKFLTAVDSESRQRFVREARSLAELEHPHIVRLFDANTAGEVPYLVMELVEGSTLREALTQGPLPPARVAAITHQVADALAYLHARGIVHRDLKPANILLAPDGTAKVADFGLARFMAAGQTLTGEGHMVGTPHFLAPEVLRQEKAAPTADVYAMGVLMYQALTGELPFRGQEMRQLLIAHLEVPPPDPSLKAPDSGADLSGLVQRMMSKEPGERPQDGAALLRELDRVLEVTGWGRPARPRRAPRSATARSGSFPGDTSRPSSGITGWARGGMALLAFVGLGLLGVLAHHFAPRSAPSPSPPASAAPSIALSGSPAAAPAAAAGSLEALLAEPIVIRVPPSTRKVPLNPVAEFTALPAEELTAVGELSDQLRHSTFSSTMSIFIPTNPLVVEVGLVEPPGGVAALQLDLFRTGHASLRVLAARRDALPIVLKPAPNRRRFTSERVPVRRGLNKIYLVFLQDQGPIEPVFVESLTVSLAAPGFAPPPPDPVPAPLTAPALRLLDELERARSENRWEDVARLGEEVTRVAPQEGRAWWWRGDAHRRLFRPETRCGLEVLDEALRRLPCNMWVWHDLGCAFSCDGWLAEGAAFLAYAAHMVPGEFWNHYDLAVALHRRKRHQAALAQLDDAERCAHADAGRIGRLRAASYLALNDRQRALAALAKALAADPTDAETRAELARVQRGDAGPPSAVGQQALPK